MFSPAPLTVPRAEPWRTEGEKQSSQPEAETSACEDLEDTVTLLSSVSLCLSFCLCVCLSVCLSLCVCVCMSVLVSVCVPTGRLCSLASSPPEVLLSFCLASSSSASCLLLFSLRSSSSSSLRLSRCCSTGTFTTARSAHRAGEGSGEQGLTPLLRYCGFSFAHHKESIIQIVKVKEGLGSPATQSCMLSASSTLHSSVQRVRAVRSEEHTSELQSR